VECLGSLCGLCGMHGVPVECLESLWNMESCLGSCLSAIPMLYRLLPMYMHSIEITSGLLLACYRCRNKALRPFTSSVTKATEVAGFYKAQTFHLLSNKSNKSSRLLQSSSRSFFSFQITTTGPFRKYATFVTFVTYTTTFLYIVYEYI
jgi:hypothetical protein